MALVVTIAITVPGGSAVALAASIGGTAVGCTSLVKCMRGMKTHDEELRQVGARHSPRVLDWPTRELCG